MVLTDIKDQFNVMLERLKETWRPFLEENGIIKEQEPDIKEHLSKAHLEWKEAQAYFNNVSEPELVDHAAFLLQAAESKYMYLLRKYRENELR